MKKFIIGLLISLPAWAGFVVPATPYPVNDYAGVLSVAGKEEIAKKIVDLKQELGVQIGVLIIPTLDGTDIVSAAEQVMGKWKLGSKDKDDGILLMLSISDRKSRIEVGRGLEGVLTDAQSKEILYSMRSFLRSGDYDGAVDHGISYIYNTVQNGKADIMAKPKTAAADDTVFPMVIFAFVLISAFGIGCVIYRRRKKYEDEMLARAQAARRIEKSVSDQAYLELLASVRRSSATRKVNTTPSKFTKKSAPVSSTEKRSSYVPIIVPVVEESSSRSSYSSSDDSSSSSSSSSSDWGGGGGDFSGGGSSDSW